MPRNGGANLVLPVYAYTSDLLYTGATGFFTVYVDLSHLGTLTIDRFINPAF